jgi:hypothetical protein
VDPANRNKAAARRLELCDAYTTDQVAPARSASSDEALAAVKAVSSAILGPIKC